MSFGKNDTHLQRIGGYGATQSQQMGNALRRQQGPRKGSPSWANNFRPSEGTPDTIRLIAGEFDVERVDENTGQVYYEKLPWFESTEHYHATMKKSIVCSAGVLRMDKKRAKPCRGCDISHEDYKERKRIEAEKGVKRVEHPNRISMSSQWVFLVLDMAWFFKGHRMDEHGRVEVSKSTGQPYYDWIKYDAAHHNEYLHASGEAQRTGKQLEMRQGMVQTWPVGFNQFGTINGYADVVQKHCKSCGNQNCIHTMGYSCSTCNAPTVETSLPPEELKKLVSKPVRCRHCNTTAYPRAILTCSYCPNPVPASLYDVDLQVQTVKVQNKRQLIVPWIGAPRPIDPAFAEAMKKLPDVPKKFAPTPYEEQVAIFGPAPGAQQAPAPYGQAAPPPAGYGAYPAAPPQGAYGYPPQGYQQPQQPGWGQQPAPQQQPAWGGAPAPQQGYYQPPPAQQWPQNEGWSNPAPSSGGWDGNAPDNNDIPF
jgi:hypothetical protein